MRVRVELLDVTCRDTEDVTGGDELYVMSALFAGTAAIKASTTSPITINDGHTEAFRPGENFVFDDDVPDDKSVRGGFVAYDEDFSRDWANRPKWVDEVQSQVALKVLEAAAKTGNEYAIVGAVALDAAIVAWQFIAPVIDPDDQLGYEPNVDIPASGPSIEDRTWSFSGGGGWWSSWDYAVRYRIYREGKQLAISVNPTDVIAGATVQVTIQAVDSSSGTPVAGQVYFSGNAVGSTNAPFTYTFQSSVVGTVVAPGYTYGSFSIRVRPKTLTVGVEPYPVAVGRPTRVTVLARDAYTYAPIAGDVLINNQVVGRTNIPFTYTFRCRRIRLNGEWVSVCPQGVVKAPSYDAMGIDFGLADL